MEMKTIQDYIDLIDQKFAIYVDKIGRSDIAWGLWSRDMNVEIRKRIEAKDPNDLITHPQLVMIISLWQVYSQLLDLRMRYRGKIFGANKIKQKVREIHRLKGILTDADT